MSLHNQEVKSQIDSTNDGHLNKLSNTITYYTYLQDIELLKEIWMLQVGKEPVGLHVAPKEMHWLALWKNVIYDSKPPQDHL